MHKSFVSLSVLALVALLASVAPAFAVDGVVNVNTAGVDELTLLPRIGPVVAERIVAFRDENGPFQSADDLLLVRGIGESTFDLLRPHVKLSGETTLTEKVRVERGAAADED